MDGRGTKGGTAGDGARGAEVLAAIRSRRVVRDFGETRISREEMVRILEAARWAPSGGNKRLHRFIAVLDPVTIRLVRAVSPGMSGRPTGLVVICIDWDRVAQVGYSARRMTPYIDVGTSAENMLLAAHAMGLGAGPVTSFSKEAVSVLLRLPPSLTPEMIVTLGHPASRQTLVMRPERPTRLDDLVYWESVPAR